jgi:hypothetical protein
MLIPQFSIRWLLLVTIGCAAVFSIVGLGVRGEPWAMAVSLTFGALVLTMLLYATMFSLIWVFGLVGGWARPGRKAPEPGSQRNAGTIES